MAIRTSGVRNHRTGAPASGADVVTFDNKRLGTVKATGNGYFEVDGRWTWRNYWLNCVLIRSCEPGRVTLHVTRDTVSRYKLDNPGDGPEGPGGSRARTAHQAERQRGDAHDGKTPPPTNDQEQRPDHKRPQDGTREEAKAPMKIRFPWTLALVAAGAMSIGLVAAACDDDDNGTDDGLGDGNGLDDGTDDNGLGDGTDDNGLGDDNGLDDGTDDNGLGDGTDDNGTMRFDGANGTAIFTMELQGPRST